MIEPRESVPAAGLRHSAGRFAVGFPPVVARSARSRACGVTEVADHAAS